MLYKVWIKSEQPRVMVGGRWERRFSWHVYLSGLTYDDAKAELAKVSITDATPQATIRPEDDNSLWGA